MEIWHEPKLPSANRLDLMVCLDISWPLGMKEATVEVTTPSEIRRLEWNDSGLNYAIRVGSVRVIVAALLNYEPKLIAYNMKLQNAIQPLIGP
jgi:hypothetical protein